MRAALVGPVHPYRGGIAHYTTLLHRALVTAGYAVQLVSFKRLYPGWLYPGESDKDPSLHGLIVEGAEYSIDTLNPLSWLRAFCRIAAAHPDVVILPWWTAFLAPVWGTIGFLNRLCLRVPVVFICHNVLPHEAKLWDRVLAHIALSGGSHFITQSDAEMTALLALRPRASVSVVPHPVYDMFAQNLVSKGEARRELGFPLGSPLLLFFGIVRPYKGLEDLLDALPQVLCELPTLRLIVAGEFWSDEVTYRARISALGLDEAVVIHNSYIPNELVPLYFSAADALVAPYRSATGSGVVQLALGHQCPVITTALEALQTVVTHGVNGFVVPPCDPAALASAVLRFYSEHWEASMRDAARASLEHSGDSWQTLVNVIGSQAGARLGTGFSGGGSGDSDGT